MPPLPNLLLLVALLLPGAAGRAQPAPPRTIHVYVALADNHSQGIVPVPEKIGRGDDPDNNLYWGCDEGLRSVFRHAADWRRVRADSAATSPVLERLVFFNAGQNAFLVADACQGREIKRTLAHFLSAAGGGAPEKITVSVDGKKLVLAVGGGAGLVAYIGHNGLMDFTLDPAPPLQGASGKPAIVLCCRSEDYFTVPLRQAGARPLLLTTQLMYPAACVLQAAVEGWLRGETAAAIHERAARAYAGNQKITLKSARGVFSAPQPPSGK